MAFTAVIFDIGGVLEVTPGTRWTERWATRLGLVPSELLGKLAPIWAGGELGAISLSTVERQTAAALGLNTADLQAFMNDLWTEYLGTLNEGLAAYFAGLRPRYRTAILSNSFVGAREREQAAYGFEGIGDVIVYSHEEGVMKPDPRFYAIVCERLEIRPEPAIFLDDRQICVDGARRAGMTAIRFIDTAQAIAEIDARLGRTPLP
jgi:epoxide hydrolase-like predicted phosphatase